MGKTIEALKLELDKLIEKYDNLQKSNREAWNCYGSELCAGDMIHQEDILSKKIIKLKILIRCKEAGILDENNNPIPAKPKKN